MTGLTQEKTEMLHSLIERSGSIVIATHLNPDGDALGSSTAMFHFVKELFGKTCRIIIPTDAPGTLSFLDCGTITSAGTDYDGAVGRIAACDLLICLDFNDFKRAGVLGDALRGAKARKVLIDHHLNPSEGDFDLCFSRTDISSASELLFHILMAMPEIRGDAGKLPQACRESLMCGMTTDTNNFANSVFPSTLGMASSLLAAGTDRDGILDKLYNNYRENRIRAMGYLLGENMRITGDGVAYIIISPETAANFDLREGETEGFVNIPLGIDRVKVSILAKQDDGFFRISIRSKRGTSANTLAGVSFHGGGHELAAGGRLYWPDDIAEPSGVAEYIENATARFMQNQ